MRNIELLLSHGNEAQREKLEKYKDKSDWGKLLISECYYLLEEEVEELRVALLRGEDIEAIRSEFADIANYAHMGIMACNRRIHVAKYADKMRG